MAVIEDVTEQKKRQRRTEAVFNNNYQLTGLTEPDGIMVKANYTALQFGGLKEEDVIGKPLRETIFKKLTFRGPHILCAIA